VQDGSRVNQPPGITAPWSDSTQNSSVNSYSAAPGHISHRSEEGRTEMWPLRAAGLVNGLWRCDERLLWHIFAPGPSCLGQCECRCGVSFLLFFRVGWIVSGRCPNLFLSPFFSSRLAGQRPLAMRRAASLASLCPRTELPWAVLMQVWSVCKGTNTKPGALSFSYFIYSSTDRAGIRGAGQPALFFAHAAQKQVKRKAPRYQKKNRPRIYV
jgi:hypothetical protein